MIILLARYFIGSCPNRPDLAPPHQDPAPPSPNTPGRVVRRRQKGASHPLARSTMPITARFA